MVVMLDQVAPIFGDSELDALGYVIAFVGDLVKAEYFLTSCL